MFQTKTITDRFDDDMIVSVVGENIHFKCVQNHQRDTPSVAHMSFSPEMAMDIRDYLIQLLPLPTQTGEVLVESVGEMTSISTSGGSIVINATGNVIINQK